jgi:hypothetical protein
MMIFFASFAVWQEIDFSLWSLPSPLDFVQQDVVTSKQPA